jgi:hypothetical protein
MPADRSWRETSHVTHLGVITKDTALDNLNVFVSMFWILGPSTVLLRMMPFLRIRFMAMGWNRNRTGLSGWPMGISTALIRCPLIIRREMFYGIGSG